ncbi:hypothetical protein KY284_000631 [Solanum tuberosum]|nr:hypothetical protein KY284_000631 [Solanum tuberosum]
MCIQSFNKSSVRFRWQTSTLTYPTHSKNIFRFGNTVFNGLRLAIGNVIPEGFLEWPRGFGSIYKEWINESGSSLVKADTGLAVVVKTLNTYGLQGHRE